MLCGLKLLACYIRPTRYILVVCIRNSEVYMAEVVKKQFKSKYHILIWIAVLSLIFMGMVEYGYVTGGRSFGNWKVHLGLIPYVAWLVLTYIATRPKWFIKRYNPKEMFEVHRIVGIVSVVLVCAHWYVYFLKALKSFLGFWAVISPLEPCLLLLSLPYCT